MKWYAPPGTPHQARSHLCSKTWFAWAMAQHSARWCCYILHFVTDRRVERTYYGTTELCRGQTITEACEVRMGYICIDTYPKTTSAARCSIVKLWPSVRRSGPKTGPLYGALFSKAVPTLHCFSYAFMQEALQDTASF